MDGEITGLAASAATTIVTLLATDTWDQVKQKIGALWRKFRPEQAAAVEESLARGHLELQNADLAAAQMVTEDWEARLLRLLAVDITAAAALSKAVAELSHAQTSQPIGSPARQIVTASDHSTVIMGGGDVTVGKLPFNRPMNMP